MKNISGRWPTIYSHYNDKPILLTFKKEANAALQRKAAELLPQCNANPFFVDIYRNENFIRAKMTPYLGQPVIIFIIHPEKNYGASMFEPQTHTYFMLQYLSKIYHRDDEFYNTEVLFMNFDYDISATEMNEFSEKATRRYIK